MQIKFIDHSFHQQTKSTLFFIEILQKFGTVNIAWDESWMVGGVEADLSDAHAYDLVVVFQMEYVAIKAAKLGLRNLLYIPMYDGAKNLTPSQWRLLKSAKILNFSSHLHEQIQGYGHQYSSYFQYYLNPKLLPEITDFSSTRGFLWQRHRAPSWHEVKNLLGTYQLDSLILHCALDPGQGEPVMPTNDELQFYNIQTSTWFEKKSELHSLLEKSNLYFAPRLDEGIGMSFIEALSMGMPVVANDSPTMNEYIVDGVNGFLYKADKIAPLSFGNFDKLKFMGQRAREIAYSGYERWMNDQDRLYGFIKEPTKTIDSSKIYFATPPKALISKTHEVPELQSTEFQGGKRQADMHSTTPIITVATVVKNSCEDLMVTLSSILNQDMKNIEVVVIDGGSDDGTLTNLRALDGTLDYWESRKDNGPYYAMNRAASLAKGKWIIFMNAGDYFCSNSSLRQLYGAPPEDADFIVGHHIYFSAEGIESVHRVRCFENTWSELLRGTLPSGWLTGVPGHQATITRTELLKEHPFDTNYQITADHDFMYRMRFKGKKFFVSPIIAAYYRGGGLSWKNQEKCIKEWISTCKKHSENPGGIEKFFEPMLVSNVLASLELKKIGDWFNYLRRYPKPTVRTLVKKIYRNVAEKFKAVHQSGFYLDFSQSNNSSFNATLDGFASSESWGCWTDGEIATIHLGRQFEGKVILTLDCPHVFSPSIQSGAFIRVGSIDTNINPEWLGGRLTMDLNLEQPASALEIVFNTPFSPKELGDGDDQRHLGLGLKYIRLIEVYNHK